MNSYAKYKIKIWKILKFVLEDIIFFKVTWEDTY